MTEKKEERDHSELPMLVRARNKACLANPMFLSCFASNERDFRTTTGYGTTVLSTCRLFGKGCKRSSGDRGLR